MLKPSERCYALIKKWEGCHKMRPDGLIEAYADHYHGWKVPTIGWGSTHNFDEKRKVRRGDFITRVTADRWLKLEVDEIAQELPQFLEGVTLTQGQFDALVSFCYNVGIYGDEDSPRFRESTMRKLILAGRMGDAAKEFLKWNKSNGQVSEGLANRRRDEMNLFLESTVPAEVNIDDSITWLELFRLEGEGRVVTGVAAYAGPECRVTWTGTDMKAFIQFISRFKNAAYAPLVAPATKPWPTVAKPAEPEKPKEVVCRLTRIGGKDSIGCEKLMLKFEGTDDYLIVRSGVPSKQNFRKANDPQCVPGSLEPIPQPPKSTDYYYIHDIDFAGSRDDYNTVFSAALGPVKVWLENKFPMRRSEFLFHVDGGAPGSAGCVCVATIAELKLLVALLRKHNPRKLFVDWGL